MDELTTPTVAEVERIAAVTDPAIRNLQITQCYFELSATLARRTGAGANWCTFATWASRQAGQTIRKEDLARAFASRLDQTPAAQQAVDDLAASASPLGGKRSARHLRGEPLRALDLSPTIARTSAAVGRGNLKVFAEIGHEFARFLATCLGDTAYDSRTMAAFCETLRPGDPPDGQGYLRQAFSHYYQALFENDPKARAELLLMANIQIGYHEQTRLQPEIQQALDAALTSAAGITRGVLAVFFPGGSWLALGHLYLLRLLRRPGAFDLALQALVAIARRELHLLITDNMLTLSLPGGTLLRLGHDLAASFPPSLQQITNPDLLGLLKQVDPTPDSLLGSGAVDWADLPERLHFIIDLFRSYHESSTLFAPPFTPGQVAVLKAGRMPPGKL